MEQTQPLFGEADMIINTLESERKELQDEIKGCRKTISRKEEEIEALLERKSNIENSIEAAKGLVGDGEGKPEESTDQPDQGDDAAESGNESEEAIEEEPDAPDEELEAPQEEEPDTEDLENPDEGRPF